MEQKNERQYIAESLDKIAKALDRLAPDQGAPNITADIGDYNKNYDWAAIGAEVQDRDEYGPTVVIFNNQAYYRRAPSNQYAPAIFFSRCTGKDESGENEYERLIIFKDTDRSVDPLPDKTIKLIREKLAAKNG